MKKTVGWSLSPDVLPLDTTTVMSPRSGGGSVVGGMVDVVVLVDVVVVDVLVVVVD